jgi:hypothetical protein
MHDFNFDDAVLHLESCLRKKRADIVMRRRESLIQGRGFQNYESYLYKENKQGVRQEDRQRA